MTCIICGEKADEMYNHPKGVRMDISFCSDCIQSLSLQWFADKLSFGVEYLYDKRGNQQKPPKWRRKVEK